MPQRLPQIGAEAALRECSGPSREQIRALGKVLNSLEFFPASSAHLIANAKPQMDRRRI